MASYDGWMMGWMAWGISLVGLAEPFGLLYASTTDGTMDAWKIT